MLANCIFAPPQMNVLGLRKKLRPRCFGKWQPKEARSQNSTAQSCSCFWLMMLWGWALAHPSVQTYNNSYSVTKWFLLVFTAVLALFSFAPNGCCILTETFLSALPDNGHLLFPSSSIFKKIILHCYWLFSSSFLAARAELKIRIEMPSLIKCATFLSIKKISCSGKVTF